MTVGLSAANLANAWLNTVRGGGNGVTFTAITTVYVQWHTGDPGASGTANVSAVTTRQAVTFGAAASGAIAISNTPSSSMTATETITHVSFWAAASAGTFLWSSALGANKAVSSGDTLNLTSAGLGLAPLAA